MQAPVMQFTLEDIKVSVQCLFDNKQRRFSNKKVPKLWHLMPMDTSSKTVKQKCCKIFISQCNENGIDVRETAVREFSKYILEGRNVLAMSERTDDEFGNIPICGGVGATNRPKIVKPQAMTQQAITQQATTQQQQTIETNEVPDDWEELDSE